MFRHALPKSTSSLLSRSSPVSGTISAKMSTTTGIPSSTAQEQKAATSGGEGRGFAELGIVNRDVSIKEGVHLSEQQRLLVGSVLDLFAGLPSKKILGLWTDDAKFQDVSLISLAFCGGGVDGGGRLD